MFELLGRWLDSNITWVFSGVGVVILAGLARLFLNRPSPSSQTQRTGGKSSNLQAGRDIIVGNHPTPNTPGGPDVLQHDTALFRRYETILSEYRLRAVLDGELANHVTTTRFMTALGEYIALGRRAEGLFLNPSISAAFQVHLNRLEELEAFVTRHFFVPRDYPDDPNGDTRLKLYPDSKSQPFDSEPQRTFREYASKLMVLIDSVDAGHREFRVAVKQGLAI